MCDFVNQQDLLFSHYQYCMYDTYQQTELFLFQNLFLMLAHFLSKQAYGYEESHAVETQICKSSQVAFQLAHNCFLELYLGTLAPYDQSTLNM